MFDFTKQEQRIILFLVLSFLVGSTVRVYKYYFGQQEVVAVAPGVVEAFKSRAAELDSASRRPAARGDRSREAVRAGDSEQRSIGSKEVAATDKIELNSASENDLQRLPKIGPVLARRIVEYREKHGPFTQIDQLLNVKGIGSATLRKLEPHVAIRESALH